MDLYAGCDAGYVSCCKSFGGEKAGGRKRSTEIHVSTSEARIMAVLSADFEFRQGDHNSRVPKVKGADSAPERMSMCPRVWLHLISCCIL